MLLRPKRKWYKPKILPKLKRFTIKNNSFEGELTVFPPALAKQNTKLNWYANDQPSYQQGERYWQIESTHSCGNQSKYKGDNQTRNQMDRKDL